MQICFASDIHCDIGNQPKIEWPKADVLIIAGDTANSVGALIKFLEKLTTKNAFKHILCVDGNHEHYANANQRRTVEETLARIGDLVPEAVTFLPAHRYVKIDGTYFVGRNGWYSFDSAGDPINNRIIWRQSMNDHNSVGFGKVYGDWFQPQPWELAQQHADEIESILDEIVAADPAARIAVVTHTAPHRDMLTKEPHFLVTNPFYVNTRMERVLAKHASNIIVWQHGHTHFRKEKVIDGVYVIANPRGYPRENPSWEPVVVDL